MNESMQGWFTEIWDGTATSIEIEKTLYSGRSPYQQIDLFESRHAGKVLALDGLIQFSERDERGYHEMLAHLPLFAHPQPEKVLIIGGGDGGILTQVLLHSTVKTVDLCEIDELVVNLCKEYVPTLARGFADPRARLHIADGAEFIRNSSGTYDVILLDLSDPVGPGEALFQKPFYSELKKVLAPGGVLAAQAGFIFLERQMDETMLHAVNELFPIWAYAYTLIPIYPSGNIGLCLASMTNDIKTPARLPDATLQSELQYYTPTLHQACFELPAFAARKIDRIREARPDASDG